MREAATPCKLLILILFLASSTLLGQNLTEMYLGREVAANEVLVKFRAPVNAAIWLAQQGAVIDFAEPVGNTPGLHRIRHSSKNAATLLRELSARPDVEYAEPNYILHASVVPNDPSFSSLWGMLNISATSAWEISTGSLTNVVGVVDSGIDYNHPDLAANVWTAPASFTVNIAGKAITCPAGSHGFNAIKKTCDPMDDNEHGTHVSGTIGAVGNNNTGVVGVNWSTQIMAAKFLDATGAGQSSDAINAIEFLLQAKAAFASSGNSANVRVINNSYGGTGFSQSFLNEVTKTNAADILFVAAAGNSLSNNDTTPNYPASFKLANIVAVAANDDPDALAYFSDYGPTTVHLAAPGVGILSTLPGNQYGSLDGTSMATPHVSGAAMLVLSRCTLSAPALKSTLLNNVDTPPVLAGLVITNGRLNVDKAIRACSSSPSAYTLTATPGTAGPGGAVVVKWTATSGRPTNDWIALVPVGQPNTSFGWWQYTNGATSGSFTVTLPTQTGQYDFRYLAQNGYADEIRSNPVTVSSSLVVPVISAVQTSNVTFSSATVTWTTSVAANSQVDYGLDSTYGSTTTLDSNKVTSHSVALSNLAALTTYHYRVRSADVNGNLAVSGDLTFTTPMSTVGFALTASPASVAPGGTLTVTWTAPSGRPTNDWVGLYLVGAPDQPAIWWTYTNGTTSGTATTTAPVSVGQYEFRYLLNGNYTDLIKSNTVSVTAAGFTLAATPASAGPGATLTVSWTAPAGRPTNDWVGFFQVGAPNSPAIWWQYTNGTTSGSATTTAPSSPGQYEFRYVLNGGYTTLLTSNTVSVTAGGFTLTASPATVGPGGSLTVSWTASAGRPTNDWVGLFQVGAAAIPQIWWQYTGGTTSGSATTTAPTTPGQYEFRYFLSGGYTDVVHSNPVTVSTSLTPPTISAVQATNITASSATITWTTSVAADSQVDYGATSSYGNSSTLDPTKVTSHSVGISGLAASTVYHYRVKSTDALGNPAVSGDFTFTTIASSPAYTLTATPANTSPGATLTVSWTAPAGSSTSDWVGLFQVGAPNSPSIWWQYTGGTTSGSASTTAPNAPGQYEFRYLLNGGTTDVVRSNPVTVTASSFTLTASPSTVSPGGTLTVTWTAPAGRPGTDWVGLYLVGAPASPSIWWTYTNGATSGSATTTAPASPGQYEFRYFLNGGYTDVVHSNPITNTIAGAFTLTATPATVSPGGTITIAWTAPSGRPSNDWIALYLVGSNNYAYVWYQYTNGATSGSFTVTAPAQTGTYEFRYLLQNGYTDAARSNSVLVQ